MDYTTHNMEPTFQDALERYASRDNATGTDKTTSHSYGELYTTLFAPLRERARNILEIGVYSGASVLAMADYFTRAHVVGIDITLKRITFGLDHPRITYLLGNATQPTTATRASAAASAAASGATVAFDLILDDGSHQVEDQLVSLKIFAPHLNVDGGKYVIEDIAGNGVDVDKLRDTFAAAAAACEPPLSMTGWHDRRAIKQQFDDIVAVFERA
jgi:predicted O-methyltransferase YrrM